MTKLVIQIMSFKQQSCHHNKIEHVLPLLCTRTSQIVRWWQDCCLKLMIWITSFVNSYLWNIDIHFGSTFIMLHRQNPLCSAQGLSQKCIIYVRVLRKSKRQQLYSWVMNIDVSKITVDKACNSDHNFKKQSCHHNRIEYVLLLLLIVQGLPR